MSHLLEEVEGENRGESANPGTSRKWQLNWRWCFLSLGVFILASFVAVSEALQRKLPAFGTPSWWWPPSNFPEICGIRKLESVGYFVALFAWSYFSHFGTILACDRQTERYGNSIYCDSTVPHRKIVGPYYHVQNLCMLYDIEVTKGPPWKRSAMTNREVQVRVEV